MAARRTSAGATWRTLGGWDPAENGNFHLYTLVLSSQTLHATGYAMGIQFDGQSGTGDPETDTAVLVYYGDGSTSQGDASEALGVSAVTRRWPAGRRARG